MAPVNLFVTHLHLVLLHDLHDGAEEGHPAVLDLRLPLLLI